MHRIRNLGLGAAAALVAVTAAIVPAQLAYGARAQHRAKPAHHAVSQPTVEQESNQETESSQPGEPAGGHQDGPGDVAHECTGDCVE